MNQSNTFKLFICDIYNLKKEGKIFMYKEHGIYYLELLGIVRSQKHSGNMIFYDIDDGTGVITCWCYKPDGQLAAIDRTAYHLNMELNDETEMEFDKNDLRDIFEGAKDEITNLKKCKSGDLMKVRGVIKEYEDRRYLDCSFYSKITGTSYQVSNAVTLQWKDQLKLYKKFYDCPAMIF